MDLQDIWDTAEKYANGNIFDFLVIVYQELKKESGNRTTLFRKFAERGYQNFANNKDSEPHILSKSDLIDLLGKYQTLVNGYIDYLVSENPSTDLFYQKLWKFIHNPDMFYDEYSSTAGFLLAVKHPMLPYYELPDGIRMDNEIYREYNKRLKQPINKLRFIVSRKYAQKTEKASVVLSVLDEADSDEEKAVLLARLLDMIAEQKNQDEDD